MRLQEPQRRLDCGVVRGPHLMAGYWERPAETAERLVHDGDDLCLHTGDLFRADADGFLYFVARRDDIIAKANAEQMAPVNQPTAGPANVNGVPDVGAPPMPAPAPAMPGATPPVMAA